ncbi:MAG: DUF6869 domain-containing protein [Planctomycetota bacterium]
MTTAGSRRVQSQVRRLDTIWDTLDARGWSAFASAWLADLEGAPPLASDRPWPAAVMGGLVELHDVRMAVVALSFTAAAKHHWTFIRAALTQATTDDPLGAIAAGPLEHLLGWHAQDYLPVVEAACAEDPRLARTITGVRRYRMTDEVWSRVRALQARGGDPLADA